MTVALTFHEPWGSAVVYGLKGIETRPTPPAGPWVTGVSRKYPGCRILRGEDVLIHTAARRPVPVNGWIPSREYGEWWIQRPLTKPGDLFATHETIWTPLGAVIGVAKVADAVPITDDPIESGRRAHVARYEHEGDLPHQRGGLWLIGQSVNEGHPTWIGQEEPWGDYTPGRWAWLLTDVRRLEAPIPVRGAQGVWRPDEDLVAAVERAPKVPVPAK